MNKLLASLNSRRTWFVRSQMLTFVVVILFSHNSHAVDLLDNTANGTATLAGSGSNLTTSLTKQGLQFDIATGYSSTLQSIRLGLQWGTAGVDVQL